MLIITREDLIVYDEGCRNMSWDSDDCSFTNTVIDELISCQLEHGEELCEKISINLLLIRNAELGARHYLNVYPGNVPHFIRQFIEAWGNIQVILTVHDGKHLDETLLQRFKNFIHSELENKNYNVDPDTSLISKQAPSTLSLKTPKH